MAPPVDPPVGDDAADIEYDTCAKWCTCHGGNDVNDDHQHQVLRRDCGSAGETSDPANRRPTDGCHCEALQSVDTTPRTAVLTKPE